VQVTIVVNKDEPHTHTDTHTELTDAAGLSKACEWLTSKAKRKEKLHSIFIHYHPASKHNNAITGRQANSWQCVYGEEMVRECLATLKPSMDEEHTAEVKVEDRGGAGREGGRGGGERVGGGGGALAVIEAQAIRLKYSHTHTHTYPYARN